VYLLLVRLPPGPPRSNASVPAFGHVSLPRGDCCHHLHGGTTHAVRHRKSPTARGEPQGRAQARTGPPKSCTRRRAQPCRTGGAGLRAAAVFLASCITPPRASRVATQSYSSIFWIRSPKPLLL